MNNTTNPLTAKSIPFHLDRLIVAIAEPTLLFPGDFESYNKFPELAETLDNFLANAYPSNCAPPEDLQAKFDACETILMHLRKNNFIKDWRKREDDELTPNRTKIRRHNGYYLTEKGMDLYLKVQAHNDAERRHSDSVKHNVMTRYISIASALISIAAVSVSVSVATQNINLAEKQLEIALMNTNINHTRLELQQKQIQNTTSKQHPAVQNNSETRKTEESNSDLKKP